MYKNREELLKELADVRNERDAALAQADEASKYINKMKERLEELSRKEAMQAECLDAAKQLYDMMGCFVEAGFTAEQAFKIVMRMLSGVNQAPTLGNAFGAIFD